MGKPCAQVQRGSQAERPHVPGLRGPSLRHDASPDRRQSACAPGFTVRTKESERKAALPDGVVGGAEVDEEVPGPVGHLQEVPHAPQVRGQEAGSPPDGGHPPGGDTNIAVLFGELEHLPMQVIGALSPGKKK